MKNVLVSVASAVVICLKAAPAFATTIALVPGFATFNSGDTVSVDAVISGLGGGVPPSVGAFDLSVGFDRRLLVPIDVSFGSFLGDPSAFEALTDVDFTTPGIANFAEVSLLFPSELDALQPSSFTLATVLFAATARGSSAFGFTSIRVDDAFGGKLLLVEAPEPSTLILLATGCLVVGVLSRR